LLRQPSPMKPELDRKLDHADEEAS
jgi:hypothetical protein